MNLTLYVEFIANSFHRDIPQVLSLISRLHETDNQTAENVLPWFLNNIIADSKPDLNTNVYK